MPDHKKGAATRQRIVNASAELMAEHGYHGMSLNQILVLADAPKGSVYFHFPNGKTEIAAAAISAMQAQLSDVLTGIFAASDSPCEALESVFDFFRKQLQDSNFRKGCPVATVALELSGTDSPVAKTCAEVYQRWISDLAQALELFLPRQVAEETAPLIFCLLEGALLVSRTTRDLKPLDDAERLLPSIIE